VRLVTILPRRATVTAIEPAVAGTTRADTSYRLPRAPLPSSRALNRGATRSILCADATLSLRVKYVPGTRIRARTV
jgi:hypothetical protein